MVSGNTNWLLSVVDRRIFAWGLLTTALLLLRSGSSPVVFALAALAGSYGLQSILSAAAPFGISSSTRALRRSKPSVSAPRTLLHTRHAQRSLPVIVQAVLVCLFALLAAELGATLTSHFSAALVVVVAFGVVVGSVYRSVPLQVLSVGATYYLLLLDNRPQVLALGVIFTVLFSLLAYLQRQWLLLGATACAALLLCVLLPISIGPAYAVVGLIPLGLVVATRERLADEREKFRQLLVPTNILASIAFLQTDLRWLAVPIFVNLLLAALAWETKRRVSYAKYFVILAMAHFFLILFVTLQSSWLVMALLLASVGIVVLGASIGSLTARLSGIAVLTVSLVLFTALVMPSFANDFLGRDGLGLLIAIILPAFASWYASLESKRAERRLQNVILEGAAVFSAATAFTLIMLDADGSLRSIALILLGGLITRFHAVTPLWRTVGLTLVGCGTVLLCTVDVMQGQYTGNILVACLLVGLSGVALWSVARRNSRPTVY